MPANGADPVNGSGTNPNFAPSAATKTGHSDRLKAQQAKFQRKIRQQRFDQGKCTRCGKTMPENDLRTRCDECRRYGFCRDTYAREFMKDFT